MAKQEEVKPNPLSLQKTDQPVFVTSDYFLEDYSEEFKTKYIQDNSQIARDLSLQIVKDCTPKTFPRQNKNIIIHVHGESSGIIIGSKLYHPALIASIIEVESSKEWPLVLDIYACEVGIGIASKEIYEANFESIYKEKLPNNCFVILNGGNKESLDELNAQEVERVIDDKDYQKAVPIRFVRKIFHNPQTIKLVYKDETGKTSFFKHSALKLEDGQKATIEIIKEWTIEGANRFKEAFIKEIDDVKEQERIRSELEDEIARLSAKLNEKEVKKLAEKTLLMEARRGKAKRVEHYLVKPFNPNCYTLKAKETPLFIAVDKGDIKTTKTLLSYYEVEVNQARDTGASPLFMATYKGHTEVAEALLKRGANPNLARSSDGCTPFLMATQKGHKEVVKLLLDRGADPNLALSSDGCTPIVMAIDKQNIEITKLLIEKVDLDKNIWQGKTIEVLIEEKIKDEDSKQKLLEAVQKRRKETLPSPKCSNPESSRHQCIVM